MTRHDSHLTKDWDATIAKLGGAAVLDASARETKAFQRPRGVPDAISLLRLVLAYCLGHHGLRLTAAWAATANIANISNVALHNRLRKCEAWLQHLVGDMLAAAAPSAARGRLIRVVDATTVPKAARDERCRNGLWRVHAAFDLPSERFGHFEVTDQAGGEQLDRIPVVKGEIRIADAAYIQPERIAAVLAGGGGVAVRVAWRNGRWLNQDGEKFDFLAAFKAAPDGLIDQPIQLCRKGAHPLQLRLVAQRLPPQAAATSRRKARSGAKQSGYNISDAALQAADWVMVVTSLDASEFTTADILALYRLRWRVELAFKRLKSVIGLKGPPNKDPGTAKVFILAHLLMILLLEPLIEAFEDSPHWANAA
jgi:Transposase DDE domain